MSTSRLPLPSGCQPSCVPLGLLILLWALPDAASGNPAPPGDFTPVAWKLGATLTLRSAYDSNAYLQSTPPATGFPRAVPADQGTLVTTTAAAFTAERKNPGGASFLVGYTPEAVIYHSATSESHRLHRAHANASGRWGRGTWSITATNTWTHGSREGPIFGGPGGATALGGIPLRDRREAFVARQSLRLQHPIGDWFVRTLGTGYVHDFLSRHSRAPGYVNSIDRQEWTFGQDLGRAVLPRTTATAGWRMGRQDQLRLHGVDSPFDSRLLRALVGLEGSPGEKVTLAVSTGPEFRRWAGTTPAGFNRTKIYWWIDASATVRLGAADELVALARRFAQPAFASLSLYEDITYELGWRHRFSPRLTAQLQFRAYGGDYCGPATREDWVHTPGLQATYTFSRACRLDFAALYDRAESRLPATAGREFRRQYFALSTTLTR